MSNLIEKLAQFDTAEISDALDACGVEGALLGIKSVSSGQKLVGKAFTVKYDLYERAPKEFKSAGNYIDGVPKGAVIVIDNNGREDCTTWGDILTQVAMMRNISGTVLYGAARDVNFIRDVQYPLFSSHIYMRSGKNRVYKSNQQCEIYIGKIKIKPDDIILGDDDGVVVVPSELLEDVIIKAGNIKETEESIITAVKAGATLEEARKTHRYDQPWLKTQEK